MATDGTIELKKPVRKADHKRVRSKPVSCPLANAIDTIRRTWNSTTGMTIMDAIHIPGLLAISK